MRQASRAREAPKNIRKTQKNSNLRTGRKYKVLTNETEPPVISSEDIEGIFDRENLEFGMEMRISDSHFNHLVKKSSIPILILG